MFFPIYICDALEYQPIISIYLQGIRTFW